MTATLLGLRLKDAHDAWEKLPHDHELKQQVTGYSTWVESVHKTYRTDFGQERWEREVLQPGGGAETLEISQWAQLMTKWMGRLLENGII